MEYAVYKNVGKNILYISTIGLTSIYVAKLVIKRRRQEQFNPTAKANADRISNEKITEETDYYANLAKVKPGFPLPRHQINSDGVNEIVSYERKSKYEGSGLSARSRKRGDKLGFLDRKKKEE